MPSIHRTIVANRLLAALPKSDLRQLLDRGEKVELAFGEVLHAPMERLSHVYFPISSFISLSMRVDNCDWTASSSAVNSSKAGRCGAKSTVMSSSI